jgi:hypothetical protein
MIKDKKLGLKVAENKEEALWARLKENLERDVKNAKEMIMVNEEFIKVCDTHIKE